MLGLFGLIMEVMQVLRSGRGTQMLVLMKRQHLVDMCVLRKVEEHRTRGIMPPKILELKQGHVVQFGWV